MSSHSEFIHTLFSQVAPFYDRMNDVMSLGWHRFWKAYFVESLPWEELPPSLTFMDMACGTGDIGRLVLKKAQAQGKEVTAFFVDPNAAMQAMGKQEDALWMCSPAEAIPIPEGKIDLYTIAFGLRNVTDRTQALKEAFRVLAPGGWFFCLEFSQVSHPCMKWAYDLYLKGLPLLGQWQTGQGAAYRYLAKSIQNFPSAPLIEMEISQAGFHRVGHRLLSYGIVAIHWGYKCKSLGKPSVDYSF